MRNAESHALPLVTSRWLLLIACIVGLAPRVANAQEATTVEEPRAPSLELARRDIVAGRFAEALEALRVVEANERFEATRKPALAELRFVAPAWLARGSLPDNHADMDNVLVARPKGEDVAAWDSVFADVRRALLEGRNQFAARQLEALRDVARDARRVQAEEILLLARDLEGRPYAPIWYGKTLLIADGISILTTPILIGVLGYVAAAPIIHLRHDRYAIAALSFGLRIAAPSTGVGLFLAAGGKAKSGPFAIIPEPGIIVAGFVGALAAMAFDDFFLAYDPPPARRATSTSTSTATAKAAKAVKAKLVPFATPNGELGVAGSW
jgi:hypothetical protein